MIKIKLTWEEIMFLCRELVYSLRYTDFKNIYGIPRGGQVIAVILSHIVNKPIIESNNISDRTLIVDDICETGHTLEKLYKNYMTATLHFVKTSSIHPNFWVREKPEELWIIYPWETEETSEINYLRDKNLKNEN